MIKLPGKNISTNIKEIIFQQFNGLITFSRF